MELLEWDARTYDSLDLPHKRWGRDALERLRLRGDETVLELGCGSGRDTERLLEALPNGRVVALDGSHQMIAQLRERLGDGDGRLEVLHRDLREPFGLGQERFDAVMSVATLHWLPDHVHVFAELARVVRAGGRLSLEAGGHGNTADFLEAVEGGERASARFWNFADIPETRTRLREAGFEDVAVRLVADEARLEDRAQLEAYVATVMLAAALRELPADERPGLVKSVCDRLPEPAIDYVRLQIETTRAR